MSISKFLRHPVLQLTALLWSLSCVEILWAANEAVVNRIAADVKYLSSDELEGRGPQTPGLEKAAEYIRAEFQKLGLSSGSPDGTYFQKFEIPLSAKADLEQTVFKLGGEEEPTKVLSLGTDYQSHTLGGTGKASGGVVFGGYGISAPKLGYDDYADLEVKGKIVIVLRHEPQQDNPESPFEGTKTTEHSVFRTKLKLAQEKGAAALIFVNTPFSTREREDSLSPADRFGGSSFEIPFAQMTKAAFENILKNHPLKTKTGESVTSLDVLEKEIDQNFAPLSQPIEGLQAELNFAFAKEKVEVANVVGVIEGAGPLSDETVVIGAHYDHLGYGGQGSLAHGEIAIHNGADDNASGTAALLEIARRFSNREIAPARRLVLIAFTAEEKGLLGSAHYAEHPLFPLQKTIAMFNYDMVGNGLKKPLTIYGVGTATEFKPLIENLNQEFKLKLNEVSGVMPASDHYSFFVKEIPCFHFFTGFTQEYHTPKDDFETIHPDGIGSVVDFTAALLEEVVAMKEPPGFVKTENPQRATRGGMSYLGARPNYTADVEGLLLNGVKENSPADKAGLQAKDIIIQFGEVKVVDIQGLADALRKYKPGETVTVTAKRGEEQVEVEVTLGTPGGK